MCCLLRRYAAQWEEVWLCIVRCFCLHCQVFVTSLPNPCAFMQNFNVSKLCNWNISFQSAVTLDDVFSFLMDFRADESLCRGTQIWNQVCCIKDLTHVWMTHQGRCMTLRICDNAAVVCLAIGQWRQFQAQDSGWRLYWCCHKERNCKRLCWKRDIHVSPSPS